jgi:hypothetical protein
MKRILSILGVVMAFSLTALAYLTAGAASGDIVCVRPVASAGLASAAVKVELLQAIGVTAPSVTAVNLDWLKCGQRVPEAPSLWRCQAGEEITLTDTQWAAADMAGLLGEATPTSAFTKVAGPATLTEGAEEAAWEDVTQAAFGVPLDSVRAFEFRRENPANKAEITMYWTEIVTLSPAAYRASRLAGTCSRGIGLVE